ncbi:hypothetical protein [uncultured Agrobacterium sp.]|uniref:hypothetical protein n=1 Tax=uncultured Agrobacterium sp. TaxID=157277 RepID=UPI0025904F5A|nr:hypothetical protein [uncultured Agrobacterium sp.]
MDDISDRIRRVATVFTPQDYAVTKSFLEGHGVLVLGTSHNLVMAAARPDSMGGLGILVPARQAQEAINLLVEIDRVEAHLPKPSSSPVKQRSGRLLATIKGLLFYNFIDRRSVNTTPATRRIIHGEWKNLGASDEVFTDAEVTATSEIENCRAGSEPCQEVKL